MQIKLPIVLRSRLNKAMSLLTERDNTIRLLVAEQSQVRNEFDARDLALHNEINRINALLDQSQADRKAQADRIVLLEASLEQATKNDHRDPKTKRFVSAKELSKDTE